VRGIGSTLASRHQRPRCQTKVAWGVLGDPLDDDIHPPGVEAKGPAGLISGIPRRGDRYGPTLFWWDEMANFAHLYQNLFL
jgi:hypothetical protein